MKSWGGAKREKLKGRLLKLPQVWTGFSYVIVPQSCHAESFPFALHSHTFTVGHPSVLFISPSVGRTQSMLALPTEWKVNTRLFRERVWKRTIRCISAGNLCFNKHKMPCTTFTAFRLVLHRAVYK